MKSAIHLLCYFFLFFVQVFIISDKGYAGTDERGYKNYYGVAWCCKPMEDIKYARQMGYDYIAINPSCNYKEYHNNPDCTGLKFYLTDPYFYPRVLSGHERNIDTTKPISEAAKQFYNQHMVWKSNDAFPDNLATGYHPNGTSTKFSIMWDLQQQVVIDEVVERIIRLAKSYEKQDLLFSFGGYIIDEPKLTGEFYRLDENGKNVSVDLSYWTGVDSGLVHDTITHEYATYAEGMAAFYKQLFRRTREECPGIKVVIEPHDIYNDWVKEVKNRADKNELMVDALFQENAGTAFVDDNEIFDSGLVSKDNVGIIQTNAQGEYENRLYAAKAGINGAWYNWSGQFDGTGDMPDFQSITEVYPRLKLIRCIPNWDNLNHVPLTDRSWDGNIYQSPKSYVSSDVMYSRHPKTGKLFAVFLTLSGAITLNAGESVASVQRTNGFFIETRDGSADVNIVGNEISLKNKDNIGKGYIFTVSSDGDLSTVSTRSETDGTSGSGVSNGNREVDANGVQNTSWFKYGQTKGSYSSTSSTSTKGANRSKTIIPQLSNSTQTQWQQVPLRTRPQAKANLSGGEGMQMIFDIDYAPTNPNIVYMVNDTAQVWKSTDGGTTWSRSHVGFRAMGGTSITVSPFSEDVVFVVGGAVDSGNLDDGIQGIFRTLDGGNTWSQVRSHYTKRYNTTPGGDLVAFTGSNTVYAGTADEGLLRSTNGGTTWTQIATPTQLGASTIEVLDVKVTGTSADGAYPKTLYVATNNNSYKIRKVVDNGASVAITTIGTGLPSYPTAIAIAPKSPTTFYATVMSYGVYKSTNSGINFSNINSGPVTQAVNAGRYAQYIDVSPVDSNYVFVGFNRKSFYYSTNAGVTWNAPTSTDEQNADGWIAGSIVGYNFASTCSYHNIPIAVHPTNKDILLVPGESNNIKKSTSTLATNGANFRYSNTGYTGGRLGFDPRSTSMSQISWNNANRFVMFLTDAGSFLTEDGGSTFRNLNVPGYLGATTTQAGTFDPTPNSNIVVTAVGTWYTQQIKITRNVNASSPSWTSISGSDANYQYIAFHPTNNNIVYAGKHRFDSIQTNNNYKLLAKSVAAMYPGNGDIVYAVEAYGNSTRIFKSINKGATWTNPYPDITAGETDVGQITIDPSNEDKIYVARNYSGIFILNNGVWEQKNEANGLSRDWLPSLFTQFVTVDPNSPVNARILYAGSRPGSRYGQANGVFRSTDEGNTWTNITGNLGPEITPWSLTVNPYNSYIYMGSSHGTWKLPPPSSISTADTKAPNCSISINNGASSTNSTAVTLTLSATDNVGVTGYYLSASSTKPLASSAGWTSVASATNYTGNVSYTLSSGDGDKTVYVWYKDAAGNVSIVANDSITLNTANVSGTAGLQALYKFDEGSGTNANDASGNGNNVTINGATWATGKSGNGLSFDGNDYVNKATPSAVLKPSLEVATAAWVKMSTTDTGGGEIVSMGDSYALRVQTNGNIQFFYYTGSTWKSIITTGVNVLDGAWHHVVGQKTSNALQIYVDGISKISTPNTGTIAYTQGTGLFIGKHGNGDTIYDFTGSIDDVSIYNRAMSNQEVLDLYNAFAIKDTIVPQSSISINNGTPYTNSPAVTLTLSATDDVGVTGYYLSSSSSTPLASATGWTSVTSTTSYTDSISYTISNGDGEKIVYVWYKDAAENVSNVASDSITLDTTNVSGTTGLQALYKFDEGSGTIANDASGSGDNGTISGATWVTGKIGSGLSFDGNNYVITATPSAGLKSSLEVATAAWIKTSAGGGEIVSMGDSYALRVQTNGNIQFFYYNGTTWKSIITTGVNALDGAWHHIVGQKTSNALQIYVDGVSQASTPNTGTISYTQGTSFFVGRHGNGGTFYDFKGLIDEAQVYNRALTDQEVLGLFNGI